MVLTVKVHIAGVGDITLQDIIFAVQYELGIFTAVFNCVEGVGIAVDSDNSQLPALVGGDIAQFSMNNGVTVDSEFTESGAAGLIGQSIDKFGRSALLDVEKSSIVDAIDSHILSEGRR